MMRRGIPLRTVYAFAGTLAALLATCPVSAQSESEGAEPVDASVEVVARAVARALESRMTVWRTPRGRTVHVSHCRAAEAGCETRVTLFSRWIAEAAQRHRLDPFVLAAMAIRESGLDPFARGGAGEHGLIQLHPHGVGRNVDFVQSEAFRARCRQSAGACQREVLEIGAGHLAEAIAHCGTIRAGLGAYNRGACGETSYSRRVMEERATLLELSKTNALPPALAQ